MNKFCRNPEILFELLHRVLIEIPLSKVDIVYVFGQSIQNQPSSLNRAVVLWKKGIAPLVGIPELKPVQDCAGFAACRSTLLKQGVPKKSIIGVKMALNDFPPSTDAEASGLVKLAKKIGWEKIIITSPPIHQFRAFISTISAVNRDGLPDLKVFNCVGFPLEWCKQTVHSQGIETGLMKDLLISGELVKILKYRSRGDLVSAEEALEYLNRRDS